MKRENIITISDNGIVSIPTTVSMQDFEIVELFGINYPTVRTNIKAILKSNVCYGDYSQGGVVYGTTVYPEFYGLDMIIAIASRVQTHNTKIFRDYILRKLIQPTAQPLFIQISNRNRDNIYN